MCLVQDIEFPSKFKILDFQKYAEASCPKGHLTIYCRKMAAHIDGGPCLKLYVGPITRSMVRRLEEDKGANTPRDMFLMAINHCRVV
uniref:Uncharacterized protein n=1 Tax=Cajanus cajan TaxID=3821 RepID=A0A151SHL1_CAJCA|nr:hypothetical protein KK1_000455 [Cajanus cajan]